MLDAISSMDGFRWLLSQLGLDMTEGVGRSSKWFNENMERLGYVSRAVEHERYAIVAGLLHEEMHAKMAVTEEDCQVCKTGGRHAAF